MRIALRFSLAIALVVLIIGCSLIGAALADKDRHFGKRQFRGSDHGNEATGQTTAWILGIANFPVALSLLLKTSERLASSRVTIRDRVTKFNRFQKRHLMKFHYWLNPIALSIAVTHWLLSHCRSTSLPEWGISLMLIVAILGLVMKFKLSPASMRKQVYRLHTNPIPLITIVSILLIGHSIVD